MAGANIPDIASDPEKGILKVCEMDVYWKSLIFLPIFGSNGFWLHGSNKLIPVETCAASRKISVGLG